jgi:hypothetical protein
MSRNRVTIAVSGGLVTEAYSTLHPNELEVELLEFDAARNLSSEAVERLRQRFVDVEKNYRKLSIDVNIGLEGTDPADLDLSDIDPSQEKVWTITASRDGIEAYGP